jgi:hypothetical protein
MNINSSYRGKGGKSAKIFLGYGAKKFVFIIGTFKGVSRISVPAIFIHFPYSSGGWARHTLKFHSR